MYTLNCKGKLLSIEKPIVMGIINVTPDSFYDGNAQLSDTDILNKAKQMVAEGADILDIGGQSTRPGSIRLSPDEELQRVIPAIQLIKQEIPEAIISIDTYQSEVAQFSVKVGASIVNDISFGELDPKMLKTVSMLKVPYIGMHMKGSPEIMQEDPFYEDVMEEILDFFIQKSEQCKHLGIDDLIIDPGFGFGKTLDHNYEILRNLHTFQILGRPILTGLSRKSMIYKVLETDAENALNGTTVLNTLALQNGASILRVHDVKAAVETIKLVSTYKNAAP